MVVTNSARQFVTWLVGSQISDLYIKSIGIGTGSSVPSVSDTTLLTEVNRVNITGSPNFTENRKVSFQADLNSVEMSGVALTEFGLFNIGSATGFAGSVWERENFGSLLFDGTNELQIVSTLEVL